MKIYTDHLFWTFWEWPFQIKRTVHTRKSLGLYVRLWRVAKPKYGFTRGTYLTLSIDWRSGV